MTALIKQTSWFEYFRKKCLLVITCCSASSGTPAMLFFLVSSFLHKKNGSKLYSPSQCCTDVPYFLLYPVLLVFSDLLLLLLGKAHCAACHPSCVQFYKCDLKQKWFAFGLSQIKTPNGLTWNKHGRADREWHRMSLLWSCICVH